MPQPPQGSSLWVFHRGALGDGVLLWPFLRAAASRSISVTLVTAGSKARLAAQELRITGLDAEQPRFNALWHDAADVRPVAGVGRVLAFDADGAAWHSNAEKMFPGARIEPRPQRPDRLVVADLVRGIGGEAPVPPRNNPSGSVVLHVGAGSEAKRWPLARFAELAERLETAGLPVLVIAGEVEAERLSVRERALFDRCAGRFLASVEALADLLRTARLFIGCDTGPSHLAAQLGIPTLAIFGQTRPELWAPDGPQVRVIAPHGLAAITHHHPAPVFDAALSHLRRCYGPQ